MGPRSLFSFSTAAVVVVAATTITVGSVSAAAAAPTTSPPTHNHGYFTTTDTLSGCHVRGNSLYAINAGWDYRCVQRFDSRYDLWIIYRS